MEFLLGLRAESGEGARLAEQHQLAVVQGDIDHFVTELMGRNRPRGDIGQECVDCRDQWCKRCVYDGVFTLEMVVDRSLSDMQSGADRGQCRPFDTDLLKRVERRGEDCRRRILTGASTDLLRHTASLVAVRNGYDLLAEAATGLGSAVSVGHMVERMDPIDYRTQVPRRDLDSQLLQ